MTTELTLSMAALVASDSYGPALLPETIAAGADLVQGTIMGRVAASGELAPYLAENADGTENPIGVLFEDVAAAAAPVAGATVGFAGVYVEDNVTGLDSAGKTALEARGIYFIAVQ